MSRRRRVISPRLSKASRRVRRHPLVAAIACALLVAAPITLPAHAAQCQWTGDESAKWRDAGNWDTPPAPDCQVVVETAPGETVEVDQNVGNINNLIVGGLADGALKVSGQGAIGIANGMVVGHQGNGSLRIEGGGQVATHGFGYLMGNGLTIGSFDGYQGEVVVSGEGSKLTVDGSTQIGWGGSGALSVLNGGTVDLGLNLPFTEVLAGLGYYGYGDFQIVNGTATITVDGVGSTLNYGGGFNLLDGEMTISNGGQLIAHIRPDDGGTFWSDMIGFGLPPSTEEFDYPDLLGVATVTVSGEESAWISTAAMQIGYGGNGLLRIVDGASASFVDSIYLGLSSRLFGPDGEYSGLFRKGSGRILVSGENSQLLLNAAPEGIGYDSGTMYIGWFSDGGVTVENGGKIDLAGGLVALGEFDEGFDANLDITSGGSVLVRGLIGGPDNGIGMQMGVSSNAHGVVTVSGAGSRLDVALDMIIGGHGVGELSVLDGASVEVGDVVLGASAEGTVWEGMGTLVVGGAGSSLSADGSIRIGDGALGYAFVQDGGLLAATEGVEVGANGLLRIGGNTPEGALLAPGSVQTPTVNLTDPTARLSFRHTGDDYEFGAAISGIGRLNAGDGMTRLSGDSAAFAGSINVSGDARLAISGALGGNSLIVAPGAEDNSSVLVDGGGDLHLSSVVVGVQEGSQGNIIVSGEGSTVTVDYSTQLGHEGAGSLTVSGGGTANLGQATESAAIRLGHVYLDDDNVVRSKGSGAITVDGVGSTLEYAGDIELASGTLTVSNGGQLLGRVGPGPFGPPSVAIGIGSPVSTVTVEGAQSAWINDGNLIVQTGRLDILDGAKATFTDSILLSGKSPGLDGAIHVSGPGSSLSLLSAGEINVNPNLNGVYVAFSGSGTLTVDNDASLDIADQLQISNQNGIDADGVVLITSGGNIAVHGTDENGLGMIAGNRRGTSIVTIDGAGSSLTIDHALQIGGSTPIAGYTATLIVQDGALVSAGGGVEIGIGGTLIVGGVEQSELPEPGSAGHGFTTQDLGVRAYATAPGTLDTPTITLDESATLVLQHTASDYVIDAAISGDGSIDLVSGETVLTGDSSTFEGDADVDAGATLAVNGSLGGDIAVADGARLEGSGTIENATIAGTLAPGSADDPTATLQVSGDLVLQSGSTYEAQIDPASGQADSVQVAGDITIESGTTLAIDNLSDAPLTPGTDLQLIENTGGGSVEGQFDNTEGEVTAFVDYGVDYSGGGISIGVARSDLAFATVGTDAQSQALGAALDGLALDNPLSVLLFTELTSIDQAAAAFDAMDGAIHADLRRVMLDGSRQPRNAIASHLHDGLPDDSAATTLWVRAMGGSGSIDADGGPGGADTDYSGLMAGIDTRVGGNTRLGVAMGIGNTSYDTDGRYASADIDSRHLALYGNSRFGAINFGYGVARSWHDLDTDRNFLIGSAPQALRSNRDAHTDQAFVDIGYRINDNIEPFLQVAQVSVDDEAAIERSGAAALAVSGGKESATFATVGLRWAVDQATVQWRGSVGWRHVFGVDRPHAQVAFAAGGSVFTVAGIPMACNAAEIELGVGYALSPNVHLSAAYHGLIGNRSQDHGARLQVTFDL